MTLQELKDYVDQKNLSVKYTWVEKPSMFRTFTTSTGISMQTSWVTLQLDARCWIEYDDILDEFSFKVNYFTKTGQPITREEFHTTLPKYPIGLYGTENNIIKWVKSDGVYNIQYSVDKIIKLPMTIISPILS
jgi:hypothetical protein